MTRPGEELERPEPESKWDQPGYLMAGIAVFWTVVVAIIIGIEVALGVPFS